MVRSSPGRFCNVRHGLIEALRGMALYSTALSSPVWRSKVTFGEAFRGMVSPGGAGSGPDGSSGVWLCKVRCFLVRSCCAGRATAECGFVWFGKVFRGMVLFCEALIGVVGYRGLLHCLVRHGFIKDPWVGSYCGVVWNCKALHSIVKFGPAKHCMVGLGAIWSGDVQRGGAWSCLVMHGKALFWQGGAVQSEVQHAKVLLRHGTEGSGFARLRAVGQASALLGMVRWSPVRFSPVRQGTLAHPEPKLFWG